MQTGLDLQMNASRTAERYGRLRQSLRDIAPEEYLPEAELDHAFRF
jgi:hypothetical protein